MLSTWRLLTTGLWVPLILHMLTRNTELEHQKQRYAGACALTLTEVTIFKWRKQMTKKGH